VSDSLPRAGPLQVAKTVFSSFLGIRRRSDHEADAARLHPAQIVVAGLIGGLLFVLALIFVVHLVISHVAG
jgi:hypothetical protein